MCKRNQEWWIRTAGLNPDCHFSPAMNSIGGKDLKTQENTRVSVEHGADVAGRVGGKGGPTDTS